MTAHPIVGITTYATHAEGDDRPLEAALSPLDDVDAARERSDP
jgi:hypothetical protein